MSAEEAKRLLRERYAADAARKIMIYRIAEYSTFAILTILLVWGYL